MGAVGRELQLSEIERVVFGSRNPVDVDASPRATGIALLVHAPAVDADVRAAPVVGSEGQIQDEIGAARGAARRLDTVNDQDLRIALGSRPRRAGCPG